MRKWLALCLALLMVLPLFAACKAKTGSLTLFEGGSGVLIYDADLLNFKEAGGKNRKGDRRKTDHRQRVQRQRAAHCARQCGRRERARRDRESEKERLRAENQR